MKVNGSECAVHATRCAMTRHLGLNGGSLSLSPWCAAVLPSPLPPTLVCRGGSQVTHGTMVQTVEPAMRIALGTAGTLTATEEKEEELDDGADPVVAGTPDESAYRSLSTQHLSTIGMFATSLPAAAIASPETRVTLGEPDDGVAAAADTGAKMPADPFHADAVAAGTPDEPAYQSLSTQHPSTIAMFATCLPAATAHNDVSMAPMEVSVPFKAEESVPFKAAVAEELADVLTEEV